MYLRDIIFCPSWLYNFPEQKNCPSSLYELHRTQSKIVIFAHHLKGTCPNPPIMKAFIPLLWLRYVLRSPNGQASNICQNGELSLQSPTIRRTFGCSENWKPWASSRNLFSSSEVALSFKTWTTTVSWFGKLETFFRRNNSAWKIVPNHPLPNCFVKATSVLCTVMLRLRKIEKTITFR